MARIAIQAEVCPFCEHDVAEIEAGGDMRRVVCPPDRGGCGVAADWRGTEGAAVMDWNYRVATSRFGLRVKWWGDVPDEG